MLVEFCVALMLLVSGVLLGLALGSRGMLGRQSSDPFGASSFGKGAYARGAADAQCAPLQDEGDEGERRAREQFEKGVDNILGYEVPRGFTRDGE